MKLTDTDVKKYKGLVYSRVKRLTPGKLSHLFEDAMQVGFEALVLAAHRYEPTRGPFETFAYWYIDGYVRNFYWRSDSSLPDPEHELPSLEGPARPDDLASQRQLVEQLEERVRSVASERDAEIYLARVMADREYGSRRAVYRGDGTNGALGEKYGLSREMVRRIDIAVGKEILAWGAEIEAEAA